MKLSIITISYNNKLGLQKTINSVLSQTWDDFEWIIIDGGSNDGTKELIEATSNILEKSNFPPKKSLVLLLLPLNTYYHY